MVDGFRSTLPGRTLESCREIGAKSARKVRFVKATARFAPPFGAVAGHSP
jgi:hypothetical protein